MAQEQSQDEERENSCNQADPLRVVSIWISYEIDKPFGEVKIQGHHALTDYLRSEGTHSEDGVEEESREEATMEGPHVTGFDLLELDSPGSC